MSGKLKGKRQARESYLGGILGGGQEIFGDVNAHGLEI